jgi:hypothetical protein
VLFAVDARDLLIVEYIQGVRGSLVKLELESFVRLGPGSPPEG